MSEIAQRLHDVLSAHGPLAIAVSGGVDSMTLAAFSAKHGFSPQMFHAVSTAVPELATQRVKDYAQQCGWSLHLIEAGEMADPAYVANPSNRCFHCKTNLYQSIAQHTQRPMASGANEDDLKDYRPGLMAAAAHRVVHPFIEAGMDKQAVRRLAKELGLSELAELPASPCLSSRIETGIPIQSTALKRIDVVEQLARRTLSPWQPEAIRLRQRASGWSLEIDEPTLNRLQGDSPETLQRLIADISSAHASITPLTIRPYRMGSTFLRPIHG